MEKKLTEKEAAEIQRQRDERRTKLFREFCRELSELPEEFQMGTGLTEESLKEYMEPLANRLYQYMKLEGMTAGDVQYTKANFEIIFGYTLTRVNNFAGALVSNALMKHFGVSDVINDLTLQKLEDEGLVVLDPEDLK